MNFTYKNRRLLRLPTWERNQKSITATQEMKSILPGPSYFVRRKRPVLLRKKERPVLLRKKERPVLLRKKDRFTIKVYFYYKKLCFDSKKVHLCTKNCSFFLII